MQSNKSSHVFINGYKVTTLENNWNEERFDLNYITDHRPLISNVISNIFK